MRQKRTPGQSPGRLGAFLKHAMRVTDSSETLGAEQEISFLAAFCVRPASRCDIVMTGGVG
jgi:hypothetical protein